MAKPRVTLADLDTPDIPDGFEAAEEPDRGATAPRAGETIRVGKYKGMQFADVYASDKGFCSWVVSSARDGALGSFAEWLLARDPGLLESARTRVYLRVPYDRRSQAKDLGARWDASRKLWYAPSSSCEGLLAAFPAVGQ